MTRVRFIKIAAAAVLAGGLTACSSTTSGGASGQSADSSSPAGGAATSTTFGTSAAGSVATPTTSASAPSSANSTASAAKPPTIGAVLGKFSAGAITVNHMPTADPAWLARVQTEPSPEGMDKVSDPKLLNLMALVDEAAREKDLNALKRLCSADCVTSQQMPLWLKPGALQTLSTLIEKTHNTEGMLFPGFILVGGDSFQDPDSASDGRLLGASSPNDYVTHHGGLATSFESGTGGEDPPPQHWTGLKVWGPYPS